VHTETVGGVEDDPPVAEFVARAFDDEGRVVGDDARRLALLADVGDEVADGPLVEAGCFETWGGARAGGVELAHEGADGATELGRATDAVALPERQSPRLAERRGHEHAVVGDLLDAPARGAEGEDVADAGLVDHLLVELADARAGAGLTDHEHAEEPAVGDGAAARDGQALGPRPTGQDPGVAIPDDPRPQFGEGVGGVASGQEVERRLEGRAGQGGERGTALDRLEPVLHAEFVERDRRDRLLREDVERVRGDLDRLDEPGLHPFGRDRGADEVGSVLREQDASGDLAHLVAGAADPLQAARDTRRGLHLDDEVDLAHVDAELEARGRDHAAQASGLEVLLDARALLLGDGSVVGACEEGDVVVALLGCRPGGCGRDARRAAGLAALGHELRGWTPGTRGREGGVAESGLVDLVEPGREPLRQPTGVGEHDGGAVREHAVDDRLLDVRPDAADAVFSAAVAVRGVPGEPATAAVVVGLAGRPHAGVGVGHVVDRDDHVQVEGLRGRRGHDLDRCAASEEPRDLLGGTHRGGEPDALHRLLEHGVEPFERDREVRAALRRGDGVDLVDDDGVDHAEGLPSRAREHEEERLGGGDEDVRWLFGHRPAVGGRSVARAHADADGGRLGAEAARSLGDADERGAEVPLDVDAEGLQRRDVEDTGAAGALALGGGGLRFVGLESGERDADAWPDGVLGDGLGEQAVDGPEECGQGLARTGRRDDERIGAAGDRVPGTRLRRRGRDERPLEPVARRGGEALEHLGHGFHHPAPHRHRDRRRARSRCPV
jgi:hypothetical protein